MNDDLPPAPEHLRDPGRTFWVKVVSDYELEDPALGLLEAACDAYDRMCEARAIVLREGAIVEDRYGKPKTHPAAALERDSRLAFARLVRELNFDVAAPDARPPRRGGARW
jgi:P27 family predicted phage terminase small subunit